MIRKKFIFNSQTLIVPPENMSTAVHNAVRILRRDMVMVLGEPCGSDILEITGSDELGLVYGILYISEIYLGFDPFWFRADKYPPARKAVEITPEPLGAEMFFRAYPDKTHASYKNDPELFKSLWLEQVKKYKHNKLVWGLGFRGQGDCPFWEQDPSYDTPEKRGILISEVIRRQMKLIRMHIDNPVFCTFLYGEITELYSLNHIDIPDEVIKICF